MAHMKLLGAMVADTVSENAVPVAESARAKSEAAESLTARLPYQVRYRRWH